MGFLFQPEIHPSESYDANHSGYTLVVYFITILGTYRKSMHNMILITSAVITVGL